MWPGNQSLQKKGKPLRIKRNGNQDAVAEQHQIRLNPNKITLILGVIAATIVGLGLVLQIMYYTTDLDNYLLYLDFLFNVDDELNIPSYFSSVILLFAAILLTAITYLKVNAKDKFRRHWMLLMIGFYVLAADEMITLHEHLNKPFKQLMGNNTSGIFTFAWVIPGMIIVAALGLTFIRFLSKLPKSTRMGFMLGGFFYVGGALGVEMLGANYATTHGMLNMNYALFTIVEESSEMLGVIIFIHALLCYIKNSYRELTLDFK
ncbi:hypothetical protein [Pollutibacter soli]|uniref:hypothetical protein n=1 Tax=Pollutibacter soli TaxID=3034157 RepID=UPI0030136676